MYLECVLSLLILDIMTVVAYEENRYIIFQQSCLVVWSMSWLFVMLHAPWARLLLCLHNLMTLQLICITSLRSEVILDDILFLSSLACRLWKMRMHWYYYVILMIHREIGKVACRGLYILLQ